MSRCRRTVATENTTLKQHVRDLSATNRTPHERLQDARFKNRFLDKCVADLEAQLLREQDRTTSSRRYGPRVPKTIKHNRATGVAAEALAREAFSACGYTVRDLNEITPNFPLADFAVQVGRFRLLLQARGTATRFGWFQMRSEEPAKMQQLAGALGHHALYVFVHLGYQTIRCGTASEVEGLCLDSFRTANYEGVSIQDPSLFDINRLKNLVTAEDDEDDIDCLLSYDGEDW